MSDIPKSKRAYSNLEAHHKALEIRRKIAVELLASFAYSEKKLEEAVRKQTQHIQDPEHRAEAAQAIRNLEEDFACWFIKRTATGWTTSAATSRSISEAPIPSSRPTTSSIRTGAAS